jgi:hypothetical protein
MERSRVGGRVREIVGRVYLFRYEKLGSFLILQIHDKHLSNHVHGQEKAHAKTGLYTEEVVRTAVKIQGNAQACHRHANDVLPKVVN